MRHVSRAHGVALRCSVRSILTSMIQVEHVDTHGPLADILTKGSCTRDE